MEPTVKVCAPSSLAAQSSAISALPPCPPFSNVWPDPSSAGSDDDREDGRPGPQELALPAEKLAILAEVEMPDEKVEMPDEKNGCTGCDPEHPNKCPPGKTFKMGKTIVVKDGKKKSVSHLYCE